jgi:hypothetical protein
MVAEGVFSTGGINSYCSTDDVFKVLLGYDLTPFGGQEALAERVTELLPLTKAMVESGAGRDFHWHVDETLALDGSGTDRLQLYGVAAGAEEPAPPLFAKALRVAGRTIASGQYRVYAATGLVRLQPTGTLARFPEGLQNVEVDLDWGFEQTPGDVRLAQAKLTAAELLAELGGEGGGVRETRIGDYAVRYAEEGRYAGAVSRLCAEAEDVVRRYRRVRVGAV